MHAIYDAMMLSLSSLKKGLALNLCGTINNCQNIHRPTPEIYPILPYSRSRLPLQASVNV